MNLVGWYLILFHFALIIGVLIYSYHLGQVFFILEDQWTEIKIARENIELICMELGCKYDN